MGKVFKNLKKKFQNKKQCKKYRKIRIWENNFEVKNLNKMKHKKIEKQTKQKSKKLNNMKKLKQFKK